ncbi:MAG: hypothetical protein K8S87_10600 [Planctomycetes bacterium]|nr:hypothetical protein [Planctomycetota bacterium]
MDELQSYNCLCRVISLITRHLAENHESLPEVLEGSIVEGDDFEGNS